MDFIKETQVVEFCCAYHLWYNVIEDLVKDDEELVELPIEHSYELLLHIAYLIDNFHKTDKWERFIEEQFKNKADTSTIIMWHETVSELISHSHVSFEYLFDEMIYVCSKLFDGEHHVDPDLVRGFFEHIVVNWELFEQSVLWIRSIKNDARALQTLCYELAADPHGTYHWPIIQFECVHVEQSHS